MGKTVVREGFWMERCPGDGEGGRGRVCGGEAVLREGERAVEVRDMASLSQRGVLSVSEVGEGDSHWCEDFKSSGWSLTGSVHFRMVAGGELGRKTLGPCLTTLGRRGAWCHGSEQTGRWGLSQRGSILFAGGCCKSGGVCL